MGVAAGITLMQKYDLISTTAPLSAAFSAKNLKWASIIISIGAFSALTTTMMTSLIGAPRVYFSMSRDGLLPKWISTLNQRFKTPIVATFITGKFFFYFFIFIFVFIFVFIYFYFCFLINLFLFLFYFFVFVFVLFLFFN